MSITVRYGSRLIEVSPGLYAIDPQDNPGDPGLYVTGTYFGPSRAERTLVGFSWAGISFTQWGPFYVTKVDGWDDPPTAKSDDDGPLAGRHGSRRGHLTRGARTVTVEGFCVGADRDDLFNQLADAMASGFGDGDESADLVGDVAGRVLRADAQLERYAPKVEQIRWGRRCFDWAIQWRCPDPKRYGPNQLLSAAVTAPVSGLTYPVTYPVTYPANPPSGQMLPFNPGNTSTPAVFTLFGPLNNSPGIANVNTGERIWFGFNLADGDVMVIDTAEGACFLNGEFRSPAVGSSLVQDMELPPGRSTLQVTGDAGGTGSPGGSVQFKPAYW